MPCNSITTQTLSGGLGAAPAHLVKAALQSAGFTVREENGAIVGYGARRSSVSWVSGKGLEVTAENPAEVNALLRREYSKAAVSWASARAGWKVGAWQENKVEIRKG